MRSNLFLLAVVATAVVFGAPGRSLAQRTYSITYGYETATEGLLSGRAAMNNAAAAMISSQAAMAKAVGDAATSNVKALESLENARSRAIENSVKAAATFYEKRKLYEAYQGLTATQRASREDIARMGRAGLSTVRFDAQGNVQWPELFLREEFHDSRAQVDFAFSQRNLQPVDVGSDLERSARTAVGQMRRELRLLMSEITPPEYAAARRFLDSVALELQLGPRPENLLKVAPAVAPPVGPEIAGK
jgi:hypothetical protein